MYHAEGRMRQDCIRISVDRFLWIARLFSLGTAAPSSPAPVTRQANSEFRQGTTSRAALRQ